jgi:hypothetical protein
MSGKDVGRRRQDRGHTEIAIGTATMTNVYGLFRAKGTHRPAVSVTIEPSTFLGASVHSSSRGHSLHQLPHDIHRANLCDDVLL